MKQNKGITLIALVVTIIVLIVLAGVSINIVLGENGIISKAKQAAKEQEIAQIKEKIGLDILEAQMEAIERNEELEESQLNDIISNYGELQSDGDTIILKDDKGEVSLLDIYTGTTVTEGSYSENKAKIELLESQVAKLEQQLEDATQNETETQTELRELKDLLAQTTVTEDKILKDYVAYKDGELITGTLEVPTLESQTEGTATADNITEGKTAWVNGKLITGTGVDNNNSYNEGKQEISSTLVGSNYLGGGGNISRQATVTHDLSSYEGYENFEINRNIFVVPTSGRFSEDADGYHSAGCNVNMSYNKSTGILTLTDTSYRLAIYYNLYVVS